MATVRLLDQLETERQVYRHAQSRSNGHERFSYMLSLGRGEEPRPVVAGDVESILRQRGKWREGRNATGHHRQVWISNPRSLRKIEPRRSLPGAAARSLHFFPSPAKGVEDTALCQRAYTLIVSPEGEVLPYQLLL